METVPINQSSSSDPNWFFAELIRVYARLTDKGYRLQPPIREVVPFRMEDLETAKDHVRCFSYGMFSEDEAQAVEQPVWRYPREGVASIWDRARPDVQTDQLEKKTWRRRSEHDQLSHTLQQWNSTGPFHSDDDLDSHLTSVLRAKSQLQEKYREEVHALNQATCHLETVVEQYKAENANQASKIQTLEEKIARLESDRKETQLCALDLGHGFLAKSKEMDHLEPEVPIEEDQINDVLREQMNRLERVEHFLHGKIKLQGKEMRKPQMTINKTYACSLTMLERLANNSLIFQVFYLVNE